METQNPTNPSAKRYSEWQVRGLAGLAAHLTVGGTAQFFEFKPKGENASYRFAFVGFGVGVGPQLGVGSAGFTTPEKFIWQTAKIVGSSFWEAGRQLLGGQPQEIENPAFMKSLGTFADIECESPFSVIDLHMSGGRLTSASASASMGWALCYITAFSSERTYFSSQSTAGSGEYGMGVVSGTTGVSIGANTNAGVWLKL